MKLTREILHTAATNYAGWNKQQTDLLGVPWPPKKGWLSALIGKEVSEETWQKVIAVRGLKKWKRKELLKSMKTPTFDF